jgi:hypothetical protein
MLTNSIKLGSGMDVKLNHHGSKMLSNPKFSWVSQHIARPKHLEFNLVYQTQSNWV